MREQNKPIETGDEGTYHTDIIAAVTSDVEVPAVTEKHGGPAFCPPIPPTMSLPFSGDPAQTIEVSPGIRITQQTIDLVTTEPGTGETPQDHIEEYQKKKVREKKFKLEVKKDLDAAREVVESMIECVRTPLNPDEKYISYDVMPPALQRVVTAYMEVEAANAKLVAAIKELQQTIPTSTADSKTNPETWPDAVKWQKLAGLK